jgi:RNA polymerase sigma-70 factor, ECF subfamily
VGASHSNIATSDDALMARLAGGDSTAMRPLYGRYTAVVRRVLGRMLPEASTAEVDELLQDVFVGLNDSASRYPADAGVERWIRGISIKRALSFRRNTWVRHKLMRRFRVASPGMARPMSTSPEREIMLRREITDAVAALPEEQRDVLLLHAAEGLSGDEIAEALGLRRETVRTRLFRARQRLLERVSAQALAELLTEVAP